MVSPRDSASSRDDDQDRAGEVQAALAQPDEQVGDQRGFLGRALDQRQPVLGAGDVDAERDDAAGLGEVTASTISATRSSPDRSAASSSASAGSVAATNVRDTADFDVRPSSSSWKARERRDTMPGLDAVALDDDGPSRSSEVTSSGSRRATCCLR